MNAAKSGKAEKFCILPFLPLKTAEPSAITGWLGHESLSLQWTNLSLLGDTAEVCGLSHLVSRQQIHSHKLCAARAVV